MKLGYTILYVDNVPDTLAFYQKAFGSEVGVMTETNEYGELKTGDTKLAFAANHFVKTLTAVAFEAAAPHKSAPPLELGFVTEAVEDAYAKAVAAGAVPVKKTSVVKLAGEKARS